MSGVATPDSAARARVEEDRLASGRSTSPAAEKGYSLLSRLVRLWMKGPFLRVRLDGLEHIPATGPVVVACNHPAMLNTLVPWAILRRNPAVLVVSYAFWVPVLGTVFRRLGNVAVRRDVVVRRLLHRDHRLDRAASAKAAVDTLRLGGAVQLYPEGKIPRRWMLRKNVIQQLRPGVARIALTTGSPVLPVGVRLGWRVGRRGVQHTVRIHVGPPILPGSATDETQLLRRVREALRDLSGLPYEESTRIGRPGAG